MELEFAPRLLQPHRLGRMGKSVSSAELLVPSATGAILWSSWIRRQLGLSSTELSAALSVAAPGLSSSVFTVESSGTEAAGIRSGDIHVTIPDDTCPGSSGAYSAYTGSLNFTDDAHDLRLVFNIVSAGGGVCTLKS